MSSLLPQLKCLPDFLSLHSKTHLPFTTKLSTSRGRIYFRTKCSISTVSPPTSTATPTVLDMEKLRLMSLEAYSNPAAADIPWTHMGAISLPTEVNFGATLVKEALVTSEEATIAAASAEAIALAKAAVQVAKDAAMMVGQYRSSKLDGEPAIMLSGADTLLVDTAHLGEIGLVGVAVHSTAAEYGLRENFPLLYPIKEADDLKPTHEELDLLRTQRSDSIAVKSRRQSERKSRRAKAAEKAAATVVSVKSSPTSRKKRASSQEVDYSDPLHYLRGTTSTYKLLTLKEEQELSGAIQDLLKLEKLQEVLAERCGEQPTFAQWAAAAGVDQKTLRKRLNYGIQCKDKMIKSNIRLVVSIAKKYQGAGMDLQDLVQEGCRGLVRSVEKFDASRGFKFSTYAHWWIKQAVRKSLSEQSRTIRLPFHMVDSTYKVKEARKRFFNENGRQPTNEEICKATGLSMKRLQAVLEVPKDPQSFDQETGMYQNYRLSEVIPDPDAESLEELVTKGFMKEDLAKVLDTLNPREKLVIKSRFGLEDGRMKTLQEIGDQMGISRERIRQIESCAFRKLKSKRRSKHLQQYANS